MNKQLGRNQKGITIIEVLIAMLILAVGLLGMASLQVRAVSDTSNASYRSIAIYYANDMADRMRANGTGITNGNYNSAAGGSEKAACLTAAGCSSADMAIHDKWEWSQNLGRSLPGGTGTIAVNAGVYTVDVSWTDRVAQDATGTAVSRIQLSFEP